MRAHDTIALAALVSLVLACPARAQQQADAEFDPKVSRPAYGAQGPSVLFDEAHDNFHTTTGRYRPFVQLVQADGFRVTPNASRFDAAGLRRHQVLVIANAMGGDVPEAYERAAFTLAECDTVAEWVRNGGALLLIADHAPFGTGAEHLAKRFNVEMGKGFTEDSVHCDKASGTSTLVFSRLNGLVRDHPITRGRDSTELVTRVVAYTGQSLAAPVGSKVLLALSGHAFDHPSPTVSQAAASPEPGMAWRTAIRNLPVTSARGRVMGLALRYGRGRVVVLGEAAMLSAQTVALPDGGVRRFGINVPGSDNQQFALSVMRWLAGVLPVE
ncbi:MAG TPA: DUF4350 domain-containing protein [Candidatus Limnocylindria bacterium]|nr:DUF4350 domain-containing protein [Candidatus Limnocylindria bacterium]